MLLNGQPGKAQTANIQRDDRDLCVVPQQFSVLCLMHFACSVFIVDAEAAKLLLEMRRKLYPDSVPTINSIRNMSTQGDFSNWDRRMECTN